MPTRAPPPPRPNRAARVPAAAALLALGAGWPSVDDPPPSLHSAPLDAALVVGVEDYATLPDTAYARADATAAATWLTRTRGVPVQRVTRLLDPSERALRAALDAVALDVRPGGVLWVWFSGQGLVAPEDGEHLLLGRDATLAGGGPSLESLVDRLRTSPASHVVIVVDASFGPTTRGGTPLSDPRPGGGIPMPVAPDVPVPDDPRVVVWSATRGTETALALDDARHGLFSWSVLGALSGWADGAMGEADGTVTLGEAQTWVRRRFGTWRAPQTPSVDPRTEATAWPAGPAVRSPPDLERIPAPAAPEGVAVASPLMELLLRDTPALRAALAPWGDRVRFESSRFGSAAVVRVVADSEVFASLPPELTGLPMPARSQPRTRSAKPGPFPVLGTPEDQARFQAEARDTIAAQAQAHADAAWVEVDAALRRGQPDARERLRVFVDRFSGLVYAFGGLEIRFTASQIPEARRLLALPDPRPGPLVRAVRVEPGTVTLGSPEGTPGHRPDEVLTTARVTGALLVADREVSRGLFATVLGWRPPGDDRPEAPVTGVTWLDAVRFANALSEREGLVPAYVVSGTSVRRVPGATGWRLPTEAEWVLAAGVWPTGDAVCSVANVADTRFAESVSTVLPFPCDDGEPGLAPTASRAADSRGLHDLAGNAAEWVEDGWAPLPGGLVVDPAPARGARARVVKGGSYRSGPLDLRAAARLALAADDRADDVGFRVVRPAP